VSDERDNETAESNRGEAAKPNVRGVAFWLAAGGLVGVVVLGVLPFWADARSEARTPTGEDLNGAVAAVREAFEPGDAVHVEPTWWTLPWQGLTGIGEGTQSWPFPSLMISEEVDPLEALGHKRVFVVAGFSCEPELPPLVAPSGVSRHDLFQSATVNAAVWEVDRAKRLRTLTNEWETLVVERRWSPDEDKTLCAFKNGKHRCGRDGWMDVALEPRVVERREVFWLFAHPGHRGSALEVSWKDLQTTSKRGPTWLYVRFGPSLEAVRHEVGTPVLVETLVDGEVVDAVALTPLAFRMERRAIRLGGENESVTVSFRVTTEDPAWRETMLNADVLDHLPVALREWATVVIER
jgi:hypothetical protein